MKTMIRLPEGELRDIYGKYLYITILDDEKSLNNLKYYDQVVGDPLEFLDSYVVEEDKDISFNAAKIIELEDLALSLQENKDLLDTSKDAILVKTIVEYQRQL